MRNLFRSGTAFLIVAAVSFIAAALGVFTGLVTDSGSIAIPVIFFSVAGMWFIIGIAVRRKYKAEHKPDSES